jgi:DeoR/GlpR family transcriptional regulator of sugar metabolism
MIKQFRFDTAFLGINGVDENGGFYCGSSYEIGIYKAVLATSKRVVVLADSSKLGRSDFVRVGSAKDISCLVTDSGIPPELLARYRELGLSVITAQS